jgi:hypothetical protein
MTREDIEEQFDAIAAELGDQEMRVLLHLAGRLLMGMRCYGPLHLETDPRDWRQEQAAEFADALCYGAFQAVQEQLR